MQQITDNIEHKANKNSQKKLLSVNCYLLTGRSGFTLIELLVVMTVMALLTTVSLANFRAGEKRKTTSLASDIVTNALRNAQNYALTGKNTTNTLASCRAPKNYFVTFTYSNTLGLFATNNCDTVDTIEIYTLPQKTTIKAISLVLDAAAATTNLSIRFEAPYGIGKATKDSGTYNTFTTAAVTVESSDGAISKVVNVNGVSGRIGE